MDSGKDKIKNGGEVNGYKKGIEAYVARLRLTDRSIPFVFLFLVLVAFGLLIPWLGLYWDDWPVIYLTKTQGISGFWDFYQYDRPLSAWTYIVFSPLLGTHPLGWHIFSLLLRWLTIVSLWGVLRILWPEKKRQVLWISLLFAVFPIFNQQAVAVAYSQHWICYLFYFLSLYFMLLAQEHARYFYPYTLLAACLSFTQMFTMEYFLGLELLRPVILWIYFRRQEPDKARFLPLKQVFRTEWIYASILGGYLVWRLFFLQLAGNDPNRLDLLDQFVNSPLQATIELFQKGIQDIIYFSTAWFVGIQPSDFDLDRPFFLGVTLVVLFGAFSLWLALDRYKTPEETNTNDDKWPRQAAILGITAVIFGTLPVWMIDRQASLGLYGSRFGLAAMFGMSVLFTGVLEWLSSQDRVKNLVVCVLVGMAIFIHLQTTKTFQNSWEKQRTFYWQLYWRAPFIEPGTAIISDGEIFPYVGLYSTSMGISLVYPPVENPQNMPYWFFNYWESFSAHPDELLTGMPLESGIRNYTFSGNSKKSLLLYYFPESNSCLRVLSSYDSAAKDIPVVLRELLSISNLERIPRDSPVGNWNPPESIFGPEPERQWCYYYEKANLASQYDDWDEVVRLMESSEQKGFSPTNKHEYLIWVDAYLKQGDIEAAYNLTKRIKKVSDKVDDALCTVWLKNIELNQSPDLIDTYDEVRELLSCFD